MACSRPAAASASASSRTARWGAASSPGSSNASKTLAADDYRRTSPRFQGENFQKNLDLVARLGELAKAKGCTASQLALAWVQAQGADIVPIPGTKRRLFLEENLGAEKVALTAEDRTRIAAAAPMGVAVGARY
jgi:aryl-alcohol dehydrogenase-like predicted oxidoreductase